MTRRAKWFLQYARGPLGFGSELWRPLHDHPRYVFVADGLRAAGREPDDDTIQYYLTRNLLLNVIHAAGGVEYTVEKIEAALDEVQRWAEEQVPRRASDEPRPLHGDHVGHPSLLDAQYETANLLGWAKALQERLDRRDVTDPRGRRRLGLIPTMAPDHPTTRRVQELYATLKREALADRHLANFAGHISAIPHPWAPGDLTNDHEVVVPVPDVLGAPAHVPEELTFEGGRELRGLAKNLLSAVERFMDALLLAFEDARVNRRTFARR